MLSRKPMDLKGPIFSFSTHPPVVDAGDGRRVDEGAMTKKHPVVWEGKSR